MTAAIRRARREPARGVGADPRPESLRNLLLGAVFIFVITFIAYWPATHAGFIWDDDDMLTANPLMTAPDGLWSIWAGKSFFDFWPLTLTSLWAEWRCWGMKATGYHVTNIVLHAAAAVLLWRALRQLKVRAGWLAALVFAVHPINVQSVAWITERKNTLSLFFCGLALLWYLWFVGDGRRRWYWLSLAAFVLALLSKTSVVMLPFVLLGCVWWLRGRLGRRDALDALPFFGVALVLGLVTVWFQYHRSIGTDVVAAADFRSRVIGAGMAAWFYFARILFPRHPVFVYPRWSFLPTDPVNYLPGALLLGLLGVFWFYRKSWGRPFLFGIGSFVVMLFPVLGFFKIYFQKYSYVADHWVYPAMMGIVALAVGGGAWFVEKRARADGKSPWPGWPFPRMIGVAAAVAIVAGFVALTRGQCGIYKTEEALWRATLARNPKCWLGSHNLASLVLEKWKSDAALLGPAAAGEDKLNEALGLELRTIALKPDHATANYGAGHILVRLGRVEEAVPYFRRAVELQPDMLSALDSLAWILATHDKASVRNGAEALRLAKAAVALSGEGDSRELETLAVASAEAGDFTGAIAAAQKALRLAAAAGDRELESALLMQVRLFQAGRPFRVP